MVVKETILAYALTFTLMAKSYQKLEPLIENKKSDLESMHKRKRFLNDESVEKCINYDIIKRERLWDQYQWCEYCQGEKLLGKNCHRYSQIFENMPKTAINRYFSMMGKSEHNIDINAVVQEPKGLVRRLVDF